MATVASLLVRIGADTRDLEDGLKGAADSLKQTGDRMSSLGGTMTKFVTGPIAAAAGGMIALAKRSGNFADKLLDLSDQTGLTTDTLQEYRAVAREAGVGQDTVAEAATRLVRELGKIRDGTGDAAKALEKLDVNITNADGSFKDMDDIMPEIIEKLQNMDDQLERNQAAYDIFGTRAEELIPILSKNSEETEKLREEAHELGLVIDQEALEAADAFRKMMDRMQDQIMLAFTAIGTDLVPVLQEHLVPVFEDMVIPAIHSAGEIIGALIEWFGGLSSKTQAAIMLFTGLAAATGPVLIIAGKLISAVGTLAGAFSTIMPILKAIGLAIGGVGAAKLALIAGVALLAVAIITRWEDIRNFITESLAIIKGNVERDIEAISSFLSNTWERITSFTQNFNDRMEKFIADSFNAIKESVSADIEAVRSFISSNWDSITKRTQSFNDALENFIAASWQRITKIFSSSLETISQTVDSIFTGIANTITNTLGGIRDRVDGFTTSVRDSFAWLNRGLVGGSIVSNMNKKIAQSFETMVNQTAASIGEFSTESVESFSFMEGNISQSVASLTTKSTNSINRLVNEGANLFKRFQEDAGGTVRDLATTAIANFTGLNTQTVEQIGSMAVGVLDRLGIMDIDIRGLLTSLSGFFSSVFATIRNLVIGTWEGIRSVTSTIWSGIKSIVTSAIDGMLTPIRALESAFDAVRGIAGSIGEGIKGLAGRARGILPFAKGGLVTRPTIGLLGEAGPEAVIPLDRLAEFTGGREINVTQNFEVMTDPMEIQRATERSLKRLGIEWGIADGRII